MDQKHKIIDYVKKNCRKRYTKFKGRGTKGGARGHFPPCIRLWDVRGIMEISYRTEPNVGTDHNIIIQGDQLNMAVLFW